MMQNTGFLGLSFIGHYRMGTWAPCGGVQAFPRRLSHLQEAQMSALVLEGAVCLEELAA